MPTTPPQPLDAAQLKGVAEKNKQATEEVKSVAEELALVHTVLDKNLEPDDAKAAIERTGAAEERLEKAADKLEEVTAALTQEAAARTHLAGKH